MRGSRWLDLCRVVHWDPSAQVVVLLTTLLWVFSSIPRAFELWVIHVVVQLGFRCCMWPICARAKRFFLLYFVLKNSSCLGLCHFHFLSIWMRGAVRRLSGSRTSHHRYLLLLEFPLRLRSFLWPVMFSLIFWSLRVVVFWPPPLQFSLIYTLGPYVRGSLVLNPLSMSSRFVLETSRFGGLFHVLWKWVPGAARRPARSRTELLSRVLK